MLKRLKVAIVKPLVKIFNASIESGIFPTNMKTAEVVPLHKSGSREDKNNYRPISLLLTISKLLEKIVYKRVYAFLDSTNQLYNSQYGFRADHSCSQAISEPVGEVAKNTEKNHMTCSIFINLSKAFDTLEHTTVIKKLEQYGIRGQTLLWFKSYLEGRKLRVRCTTNEEGKQEISDTYSIEYGTPQGSCMGPLIFLIFCNDISLSLQHMHCIQFADDTTLYFSHQNANYLQYCVNSDLQILQDWFWANKLTLNASKSVCLIFNLRDYLADLKLMMSRVELPILSETKFLGVWIDNKLTWKRHVDEVVKGIKNRINLL